MKHLNKNDLNSFMERFERLSGGEIVSLEIINPTTFKITLTVQDKNRGYDWVNMNFECSEVSDAKLLDDKALKAVDMEEGACVNFTDEGIQLGFGSEEYLSSPLHLQMKTLKYEESDFAL